MDSINALERGFSPASPLLKPGKLRRYLRSFLLQALPLLPQQRKLSL